MNVLSVVAACVTLLVLVKWYLARTPLSREAYLEKHRILERDRSELMAALKYRPNAPDHIRQANCQGIENIDKQLLALAERVPANQPNNDHPRTETKR